MSNVPFELTIKNKVNKKSEKSKADIFKSKLHLKDVINDSKSSMKLHSKFQNYYFIF